jgi:hypothetical protein
MIPIVLMLSVVLLLWALRMLLTQQWPQFEQLASIFSGYVLLGVWLTIMVANAQHGLARFYRRVFPLVAILFLLVEAVAIVRQVIRWVYVLVNTRLLLSGCLDYRQRCFPAAACTLQPSDSLDRCRTDLCQCPAFCRL